MKSRFISDQQDGLDGQSFDRRFSGLHDPSFLLRPFPPGATAVKVLLPTSLRIFR